MRLLDNGHFNQFEPGILDDVIAAVRNPDDPWMTAADFRGFIDAQEAAGMAYQDSATLDPHEYSEQCQIRTVFHRSNHAGLQPGYLAPGKYLPGSHDPGWKSGRLGAHWDGEGVNFALYSSAAEAVELCLFDASGQQNQCFILPANDDGVWHGYLPGCEPGQRYGYRVHGQWAPEADCASIPQSY